MRYLIILLAFLYCQNIHSQKAAIRVNVLPFADKAIGWGVSYPLKHKSTIDLAGTIRPWKRSERSVNRYWILQPEYRYWVCQKYNGSFWGVYLSGAQFNIGGKKYPFGVLSQLQDHRYEGWILGGGISYGYHWMLNNHWNMEASLGIGYNYINYTKFNCPKVCAGIQKKDAYHYFGPGKASLSIIYLF